MQTNPHRATRFPALFHPNISPLSNKPQAPSPPISLIHHQPTTRYKNQLTLDQTRSRPMIRHGRHTPLILSILASLATAGAANAAPHYTASVIPTLPGP